MQLIGCYIAGITGKPIEFHQIYQTFSYIHDNQKIDQTTKFYWEMENFQVDDVLIPTDFL